MQTTPRSTPVDMQVLRDLTQVIGLSKVARKPLPNEAPGVLSEMTYSSHSELSLLLSVCKFGILLPSIFTYLLLLVTVC